MKKYTIYEVIDNIHKPLAIIDGWNAKNAMKKFIKSQCLNPDMYEIRKIKNGCFEASGTNGDYFYTVFKEV